jgi:hypothetical protein
MHHFKAFQRHQFHTALIRRASGCGPGIFYQNCAGNSGASCFTELCDLAPCFATITSSHLSVYSASLCSSPHGDYWTSVEEGEMKHLVVVGILSRGFHIGWESFSHTRSLARLASTTVLQSELSAWCCRKYPCSSGVELSSNGNRRFGGIFYLPSSTPRMQNGSCSLSTTLNACSHSGTHDQRYALVQTSWTPA